MSIKLVARELYQCCREVSRLENRLAAASPDARIDLENQLRQARARRDWMRNILDGKKASADPSAGIPAHRRRL